MTYLSLNWTNRVRLQSARKRHQTTSSMIHLFKTLASKKDLQAILYIRTTGIWDISHRKPANKRHVNHKIGVPVKTRLKSQNLIMRFWALKFDFRHSFHNDFNLWHGLTQTLFKISWLHFHRMFFTLCCMVLGRKLKIRKKDFILVLWVTCDVMTHDQDASGELYLVWKHKNNISMEKELLYSKSYCMYAQEWKNIFLSKLSL